MSEEKSNVLFIIPSFSYIEDYQKMLYYNDYPLGVLQICSYLQKYGKVLTDIIDLRLEAITSDISQEEEFRQQLIKILEQSNIQDFSFVGLSCYTSFQYQQTILIAKIIRAEYPKIKIFVGGYHPSAIPDDFIYSGSPFDYIIQGEAELLLQHLLKNGKIRANQKQNNPLILHSNQLIDLSSLPFPDYENFLNKYPQAKEFRFDIYISRGCPNQCAFCAENYKFREISMQNFKDLFNKVLTLIEKKSIQNPKITFADQSFNEISISNQVLDYLLENNLQEHYKFSCQSRIETIKNGSSIIDKMIKCNIIVGYGLESINKNLLIEMHKTKDPINYIKMAENLISIYRNNANTYCRLNILAGFPGETHLAFTETVEFLEKNALDENIQISPTLFSNYPNVFVYKNMKYYEEKYNSEFIKEWWKLPSNPLKSSVPIKLSKGYIIKELIYDYKERYASILRHFKHDTFSNIIKWKQFLNSWYKEIC